MDDGAVCPIYKKNRWWYIFSMKKFLFVVASEQQSEDTSVNEAEGAERVPGAQMEMN